MQLLLVLSHQCSGETVVVTLIAMYVVGDAHGLERVAWCQNGLGTVAYSDRQDQIRPPP